MVKPELSHYKDQWVSYALSLEEEIATLKSGTQKSIPNNGKGEKCPKCHGTGDINPNYPHRPYMCKKCKGTGQSSPVS